MIVKKFFIASLATVVALALFFALAPVIPMPIELQKCAMSVLYSDQSYAENMARAVTNILQHPAAFGFKNQEEVLNFLKAKKIFTADGRSRQFFFEFETLGDIGWPTVVSKMKITLVYRRDGSRSQIYQYDISSFDKT